MKVVARLMVEAEKKINEELKIINKDIEDFGKPVPIPSRLDPKRREEWFEERQTGRLSSEKLTKNYEKKNKLENELIEIANFKYHHKEWFE